ncbi:ABC-2 type transport system permease protein [Thermoanaerobacter thermohydrosulfuricus]|uniref:ABC-type multidrug transport system, permease component n=2 Tax=Thermoanaerobacter thermohydrosulfuricus TaxID=1516 RepID=M8CM15_THETY|nr:MULTISPECIES: ABC transporter permease [Thermoanaerobacter]EMT38250.1 ABC-type multidrug transport system, permease component [Thermoanaerobacter thermohydrosulfuricus WC1]SDF93192.1 ABC-2 type transport system permease protein [Thermoanaerobacter thermohydrosulfuricus]
MNKTRLFAIIKKEIIHIKRDRISLVISFIMPITMLLLFGYAVATEVDHIPMAVFDQSKTYESRSYIEAYKNSLYFNPDFYVSSIEELNRLLDEGKAKAGLIIPPDFSQYKVKMVKPLLKIDGSDPTTARTALSSGIMVSQMFSNNIVQKELKVKGMKMPSIRIDLSTKVEYNPELNTQVFTIPGLLGLIMQNITIILTAFALVREKERGTIEQLIVTPIKSSELMIGKLLPYILIGYTDFLMVLGLSMYWFGVPVRGNIYLLLLLGLDFITCALAIGILISTVAQTQTQAMQGAFFVLLPTIILSGFIFPREQMPTVIRAIGDIFPLTYFLVILRGIIIKGIDASLLVHQIVIITLMSVFLLTVAILRFKKRLD